MGIVRVVLDSDLLRAADRAARKLKTNRSALLRQALRAHLKRLDLLEKEKRDREGYVRYPDSLDEPAVSNKVVDCPAD
jgi:metal-responsive CopG/Arc/MetJ family transcriptional regulator